MRAWVVLLAILLLTSAVRYRLLDIPLERDEGEYAYAGQLILQGVPPYESVYNMKLPGIYGVYAILLAVFGETATRRRRGARPLPVLGDRLRRDLRVAGATVGGRLALPASRVGEPGDRIAVLGSEPQIYFYANRRSATGYVYAYPLMEEQPFALEMQEEMIREIEAARPRFVVYVGIEPSWRQRATSPTRVFEWFQRYQAEHYEIVGLVEVLPDGPRYHWGPNTRWPPSTRSSISAGSLTRS